MEINSQNSHEQKNSIVGRSFLELQKARWINRMSQLLSVICPIISTPTNETKSFGTNYKINNPNHETNKQRMEKLKKSFTILFFDISDKVVFAKRSKNPSSSIKKNFESL